MISSPVCLIFIRNRLIFFTDELSAKSLEVIGELFPTGGSPTDASSTYGLARVSRELCETVQDALNVLDALELSNGHLEIRKCFSEKYTPGSFSPSWPGAVTRPISWLTF
ncbi:unnamed protein product [Caenorhabditis auriculariae]|uniref:Uncharacterized protein n=1 Tax=Caenorhabditis auriculariae TaxID=2777116 RepID=A0A8S1HWQ0_9PELO|nr:unnamed protein product [Caenorhabditis auriculariae]